MVIDISSKLNNDEEAKIKIADGKEYIVDCGAETMLRAQEIFTKGQTIDDIFEVIKLFLGQNAAKEIREMNLKVSKLYMVIIAIMAQSNEVSYEEMEKRFQEQFK